MIRHSIASFKPLQLVSTLFLSGSLLIAQPSVSAVVNGASLSNNLAPGTLASVYGSQLAPSVGAATSGPLPNQLNGVTVKINGIATPLLYVSPNQINFLIPFEVADVKINQKLSAPLVVETPNGASAAFALTLTRSAPALFTLNGVGTGTAIAFDSGSQLVTTFDGNPIVLYAAGLGSTSPPAVSANGGATSEPLNRTADLVAVFIGDQPADVLFAGLAPGLPGVYQLNVVPKGPISNRVYLSVNGVESNITTLGVPAGTNVTSLSGSIEGLYPVSGPAVSPAQSTTGAVSFSALLIASIFQVAFDIKPDAKPFQVIARNAAASDILDIDPGQGTWRATITVPAAAERVYDFSAKSFRVIDFLTGMPFPANIVPLSRTDPIARNATSTLPLPNQISGGVVTTVVSGALPANRHFVIDANTFSQVSRFGAFTQIPQSFGNLATTKLQLFVDGLLVASKEIGFFVD